MPFRITPPRWPISASSTSLPRLRCCSSAEPFRTVSAAGGSCSGPTCQRAALAGPALLVRRRGGPSVRAVPGRSRHRYGHRFCLPAFDALVPQLVAGDRAVPGQRHRAVRPPGAIQLAGPALGGFAVAVLAPAGSFALDAASFAFSAFCVARMGRRPGARPVREPWPTTSLEGLRYVRSQVWLWGTFVSATLHLSSVHRAHPGPLALHRAQFAPPGSDHYGAVLAVGGVGALIGALPSGRRRHPRAAMTWIYGCGPWPLWPWPATGWPPTLVGLACAAVRGQRGRGGGP